MWKSENTKIESKLVKVAKEKAYRVGTSRHASCLVYRKKIISVGWNKLKTHPVCLQYQPNKEKIYLHAEQDAIIKAINQYGQDLLKLCDLYVLRITNTDRIACSKPCEGCKRFIDAMEINNVFHT